MNLDNTYIKGKLFASEILCMHGASKAVRE